MNNSNNKSVSASTSTSTSTSTKPSSSSNRASSISKLITNNTVSSGSTKGTSTSGSSLVDNIISKVKDNEKNNIIIYLIVAIPVLLFLGYLVYKYNFSSRSSNVISLMNYQSIIDLEPLQQCYEINPLYQYKLCDYYISSSFMTPCVGNQHYDYVSLDMISEVIKSGARYIQIPVCESDVTINALPVVGTAVYGQRLVTSLNTLEMQSVLNTIITNAFTINNNKINYPLIIHFVLHTSNTYTINILAAYISKIFQNVLVDVTEYQSANQSENNNIPIHLEKLCNLLGKIIIYSTPGYLGTDLEKFVIPTTNLYQIYNFEELGPINMPNNSIYTNTYNQKLSGTEQKSSNVYFKKAYPSMDYVLENINTIGEKILNDTNILNNLTSFNKLGMSIVKPHYPEDVVSKNYDPTESIFYGCQFTTMNFQNNDLYMQTYIQIFKDSSFRLKPGSLRFSETEVPIVDFSQMFQTLTTPNANILGDFFYKYGNILIALESYTLLNTYLTQSSTNLSFNVGTKITKDKNGKKVYNIGLNQLFIPRLSRIGSLNNISMYLESASNPNQFITMSTSSNIFYLSSLGTTTEELMNQAMYIEKPKLIDNNYIGDMISGKSTNETRPLYLAAENKEIKAYADSNKMDAKSNMTFIIHKLGFRHVIKIITKFGGSIITNPDNSISILANNNSDGTSYYVNPHNQSNGNNFNIFNDQFTLQNKTKGTFVTYDSNRYLLYDRMKIPDNSSIFNLVKEDSYYLIMNVSDEKLLANTREPQVLTFQPDTNADENANLFSISISYELA
jgi:hypothetical protein